jgi:pilus assembly protein Flp/PilA
LKFLNNCLTSLIMRLAPRRDEEDGQTLVEYGLIVALISIVAITALTTVGGNVEDVFNDVAASLTGT